MGLRKSSEGDVAVLQEYIDWLNTGAQIGLFNNNVTPANNISYASWAINEATFTGYARQNITSWPAAAVNGAGIAEVLHPTITWTLTGGSPEDIYGIFVIDPSASYFLWYERHPLAPITLTNPGDPFAYTPRLKVRGNDAI